MMSRRWQQNERVLAAARTDMWPRGYHKLGVHWASGLQWNKEEIDRRIAKGEYTAAQCLSRLTDGMPNHEGPPNGPGRPTLATKWRKVISASREDIEQHVAALREHVAMQVAQQLGMLAIPSSNIRDVGGGAAAASSVRNNNPKRPLDSSATQQPQKLARTDTASTASTAATSSGSDSSVFMCGLRLTGRPGDPIPSGGRLSTQIFVKKSQSVRQNQQTQLSKLKAGELSIEYALYCMRMGGPLRRHWQAAQYPELARHIDELCKHLEDLRQRARDGSYDGA